MANPKTPTRRYRGVSASERVAARRLRLLDAALELYGTRGFAATGVKDICREARLTDRYFYESFPDAAQLFAATYDRAADALLASVAEAVAGAPSDPERQVRVAIGTFARSLADDPRAARVLFVETASAGPEVEQHVRATLRRFAGLVAATARPHLSPNAPAHLVEVGALSLVGAIQRVVIEWQAGDLDASLDEIVEYLVRLFLAAGQAAGLALHPEH
jgi:AcrR family transcriptional regulator